MRILIFSQHFWPESFRINEVAADIAAAGHEVTVLTGQPNYPSGSIYCGYRALSAGRQWHHGLEIQRVPLFPRGKGSTLSLIVNYLSFVTSAALLGAWRLRSRDFDVIFVYGTSPILQAIAAVFLARLKQCALVTWVQDLWPQSLQVTGYVRHPSLLRTVEAVVRWIYSRNDLLLVQSRAFEAPVRQLAPISVPIAYHPNPGGKLEPRQPESGSGVTVAPKLPAGFTIVFAGNLGTAQALDTVLEAATMTRDDPSLSWVFVGDGQRSAWLRERVQSLMLGNVVLTGQYPPQAMPTIFAQASALLVSLSPDPAMSLTIPSKLQTYLAAGRPILASMDGEGARLVREARAGVCAAAGDPRALVAAVHDLRSLPEAEREAMGRRGQDYYARCFDPQRLTDELIVHLRDAADRRRPHRVAEKRQ